MTKHFIVHVFEIGSSTGLMIPDSLDSRCVRICSVNCLFMLPKLMPKYWKGPRSCLSPKHDWEPRFSCCFKILLLFFGSPTCALKDYSTHPRICTASGADWTLATSLCRDMVCRGLTAGLGGVWPLYLSPQQRSLLAPGVSLGHSHLEPPSTAQRA